MSGAAQKCNLKAVLRTCDLHRHFAGSKEWVASATECKLLSTAFGSSPLLGPKSAAETQGAYILLVGPNKRGTLEIIICRILLFMWPYGPLLVFL